MTTRTGKKTLQSFQARSTLWSAYQAWGEKMDCSVDYLINEAMRMYAADKGFLDMALDMEVASPAAPSQTAPTLSEGIPPLPPRPPKAPRPGETGASGVVPRPPSGGVAPVPPRAPRPSTPPPRPGAPAPPRRRDTGSGVAVPAPPVARPQRDTGSGALIPPRPPGVPAPPRPAAPTPGLPRETGTGPGRPVLTLIFEGRKVAITQDQFILGRGSKSADLTVKDPNISRKHAAIIFHNGAYYMKDLGSTNGIEFNGQPVDSKRIDEGDVFSICGHHFHFTYSV